MNLVAIPLSDGRWVALSPEELRTALDRAASLGLGPIASPAQPCMDGGSAAETWLTSEQLQAATGICSTTWEARAKSGEVPCLRVGRSVRFKLTEIEAASRERR